MRITSRISESFHQRRNPPNQGVIMSKENAAAGASAEKPISAVEAERERREAIIALCSGNKIDSRVERSGSRTAPLQGKNSVADQILRRDSKSAARRSRPALPISRCRARHAEVQPPARDAHLRYGSPEAEFRARRASNSSARSDLAKQLNRNDSTSILIPAKCCAARSMRRIAISARWRRRPARRAATW
jgi:hypothetical protein